MSKMPISLSQLSSFCPSLSFRDNLAEIPNHILLIREASMQRKSHLVLKLAVGIRIVLEPIEKIMLLYPILRRIAFVGFNKINHLFISFLPTFFLRHTSIYAFWEREFLQSIYLFCHNTQNSKPTGPFILYSFPLQTVWTYCYCKNLYIIHTLLQ